MGVVCLHSRPSPPSKKETFETFTSFQNFRLGQSYLECSNVSLSCGKSIFVGSVVGMAIFVSQYREV